MILHPSILLFPKAAVPGRERAAMFIAVLLSVIGGIALVFLIMSRN
jgi:hypothetical protein